jgi:hypothetical protein
MPTPEPPNQTAIDTSAEAIEQRLRDLAQLYRFGMVIEEARQKWSVDGSDSRGQADATDVGDA